MGKYEPLSSRLNRERENAWTATFPEIENVLGFRLPPSARKYREWWANQRAGGHSQAKGWQEAGWQVWRVDLADEKVEFRRRTAPAASGFASPSEMLDEELLARASVYLGVSDRAQIIREGLKALCQREAGRRLARLGGTMPDLQVPPRRRFGG